MASGGLLMVKFCAVRLSSLLSVLLIYIPFLFREFFLFVVSTRAGFDPPWVHSSGHLYEFDDALAH